MNRSVDIERNLKLYLQGGDDAIGRTPNERYTSFDYCFNYFQSFYERGELDRLTDKHLETSCLQLGFYLASWGMYRGSSQLPQKSVRALTPLVECIVQTPPNVWLIDAHRYDEEKIELLIDCGNRLSRVLPPDVSPTDTLITKIMLGVFGNIPAFDSLFCKGFGVSTFGKKALRKIGKYYQLNADTIEQHRVMTLDFSTGKSTNRPYTRAKVIDMIFFIEGFNL